MISLNNILASFEPISLEQMDRVKLQDRIETKYAFHISKLATILEVVKDQYAVLEIANKRISKYESLYYDTENLHLFNQHHNGKLNRYKIRYRHYADTGSSFFEIKFKSNKGRTIKNRIAKTTDANFLDQTTQEFIAKQTPFKPEDLKPIVWTNYNRLTLVNKLSAERVTLDLQLQFLKNTQNVTYNSLVIAEVKQDKKNHSPFIACMKNLRIRQGSISKYCMAIGNTSATAKTNNFKLKLAALLKYKNDN